MTAAIDYKKYENLSIRKLGVLLDNAEKRLNKEARLVDFLRQKIVESARQEPKQYKFAPYAKAREKIVVEPPFSEQEKEQLRQEVNELVNKDYNNEL